MKIYFPVEISVYLYKIKNMVTNDLTWWYKQEVRASATMILALPYPNISIPKA